ncbi:MAG TPA: ferredoxin [Acidilobales archaeon]|nr:MAG: ferredoxin [Desulfurococcales archaeon ex4484_42]HDN75941.1 ferredoxin [Acidilobales archaeon]
MVKYKVTVNKETCIACGVCYSLCPKVFEAGEDGKSTIVPQFRTVDDPTKSEGIIDESLYSDVVSAKDSCPTGSISVEKVEE